VLRFRESIALRNSLLGSEVAAFQEEMRKGRVDWQLIIYGNAVHSFTQRTAGTDKSKGSAYDKSADKRSWEAMESFFKETIGASLGKWKSNSWLCSTPVIELRI